MLIHPSQPHIPNVPSVWLYVLGILVIGTLIPFQLANNSLKYINATTFSLMDAFEPLSATIGSVLIFHLQMTGADILGSILVIVAVLAINIRIPHKKIKELLKKKVGTVT